MVGRQPLQQEQEQQFNALDWNDADVKPSLTTAVTTPVIHFEKWKTCVQHLMEQDIVLVGVEIHPDAVNLDDFCNISNNNNNDNKNIAFLMGNEGQGIHEKHMASCQAFVKIPQYGGGTASLNVNVAASIVLHSYHLKILHHQQQQHQHVMREDHG